MEWKQKGLELHWVALALEAQNQNQAALQTLLKAETTYERIAPNERDEEFREYLANVLHSKGGLQQDLELISEAIESFKRELEIRSTLNNTEAEQEAVQLLGLAYLRLGQKEEAEKYLPAAQIELSGEKNVQATANDPLRQVMRQDPKFMLKV